MSGVDGWKARVDAVRTAQTVIRLETGGKAMPKRRNLFSISASASRQDPFTFVPMSQGTLPIPLARVDAAPELPAIVSTEIIVGDLGRLGSDGRLYKALFDGETRDITPRVAGVSYYTFSVAPQKHELKILANGYSLAPDRVRPEANYCVGQKMNLSSLMIPSLDSAITHVDYYWSLPGVFINYIEDWPNGAKRYLQHWPLTYEKDTPAWWVTGGEKHVRCDWTLTFNNGQTAKVYAMGRMNMHRPSLMNFVPKTPFTINIIPNFYPRLLKVGNATGVGKMDFDIGVNSKFAGMADITQLVNAEYGSGVYEQRSTGGQFWLDNVKFPRKGGQGAEKQRKRIRHVHEPKAETPAP